MLVVYFWNQLTGEIVLLGCYLYKVFAAHSLLNDLLLGFNTSFLPDFANRTLANSGVHDA